MSHGRKKTVIADHDLILNESVSSMPRMLWLPYSRTGLLVLYTTSLFAVQAYNDPSSPSWPSEEEWSALGSSLSEGAALHGPILRSSYSVVCERLGTDPYAIAQAGVGICMQIHQCKTEFCRPNFPTNLPVYVLDPRTPDDIRASLQFANQHDIRVSVKTTGHTFQGSSTARDSLLIWMANYPKDDVVTEGFVDSCGTTNEAVVGVGGGETFNDVLEGLKGKYHVVTGSCRTVSFAGGWLQGGGLSFTSRLYGIGVDQVVEFDVVLANGTAVKADACTNPDLFWALRGGGGGTFGIVTHVQYRVHPVTPITVVPWFLVGTPTQKQAVDFIFRWLDFWVQSSPYLDEMWSGFFNGVGVYLVFAGTKEEAKASFVNEFDDWYWNKMAPLFTPGVWGAFPPSDTMTEYDSWYEFKGGAAAYNNPKMTDQTGEALAGIPFSAARLMPRDIVITQPDPTRDLLVDLMLKGSLSEVNYFLGGAMTKVPTNETAVHPAMRQAIWALHTANEEGSNAVREFIPNNVTGVSFNHHSTVEPDWRNACWGTNYERLEGIKEMYDPEHRFNCWHGVGYVGEENPLVSTDPTLSPVSPTDGPFPTDSPPTAAPASSTKSHNSGYLYVLSLSILGLVLRP